MDMQHVFYTFFIWGESNNRNRRNRLHKDVVLPIEHKKRQAVKLAVYFLAIIIFFNSVQSPTGLLP